MSNSQLADYADQAARQSGLTTEAILTHWIAENGPVVPDTFDFANILYFGDLGGFGSLPWHQGAKLARRASNGGWILQYNTPTDGINAYVALLKAQTFVAIDRTATMAWIPEGARTVAQLAAIAASPWDEGNYGGDGGGLWDANTTARQLLGLPAHGQADTPAPAPAPAPDPQPAPELLTPEVARAAITIAGCIYRLLPAGVEQSAMHSLAQLIRELAARQGLGQLVTSPAGYLALQLADGQVI